MLFKAHVACHTLINRSLLPPTSRQSPLHYRVRLTWPDPDARPQSSLGKGFRHETGVMSSLCSFFLPFSFNIHLFFSFLLTLLYFCVLTWLIFPALLTLHPPLWGHSAMTNRHPLGKEGVGFLFFPLYPSRVLCMCVGGGRGSAGGKRKHPNINRRERLSQDGKLMGGRRPLTDTHTQRHSSSLPHTCSSVLFGLKSVW